MYVATALVVAQIYNDTDTDTDKDGDYGAKPKPQYGDALGGVLERDLKALREEIRTRDDIRARGGPAGASIPAKRLLSEMKLFEEDYLKYPGISLAPNVDTSGLADTLRERGKNSALQGVDVMGSLLGTIEGPPNTPYEGGIFAIEVYLSKEYPIRPPFLRFHTKIYHPNVNELGHTYLELSRDTSGGWSPALKIVNVLMSVRALLESPELDSDHIHKLRAELWRNDRQQAEKEAMKWTAQYAIPLASN